jgi:hypothetical protein
MKFLLEPVEGNGWYIGNDRIDTPSPFWVDQDRTNHEGIIYGIISDVSSKFNGGTLSASPRYLTDRRWLNVEIQMTHNSSSETDKEQSIVFGYAKVDTVQ